MKCRVFLDTNIFIYAFEFPESNSSKVIALLNKGQIEAVISERVLKEAQAYFKKFHSKDLSALFRDYLLRTCVLVFHADLRKDSMTGLIVWRGKNNLYGVIFSLTEWQKRSLWNKKSTLEIMKFNVLS